MSKIPNIPNNQMFPTPETAANQERLAKKFRDLTVALDKAMYDMRQIMNQLINGEFGVIQLEPQHAEPLTDQLKQGTIAYADGTDWDPGSGEGVYRYDGSNWNYLG